MGRYAMSALLEVVEGELKHLLQMDDVPEDRREEVAEFLDRLDGPEFQFTPPGPEDEGGNVVCLGCGTVVDVTEASITVDETAENADGDTISVTRHYLCSQECGTDMMAAALGVEADE